VVVVVLFMSVVLLIIVSKLNPKEFSILENERAVHENRKETKGKGRETKIAQSTNQKHSTKSKQTKQQTNKTANKQNSKQTQQQQHLLTCHTILFSSLVKKIRFEHCQTLWLINQLHEVNEVPVHIGRSGKQQTS
jgi:hypothetical protein